MNFKALIASGLIALSSIVSAQTCHIVSPYAPGGPADDFVKAMQSSTPEIDIVQHRPGAFASRGIDFMRENPDYIMAAAPLMWTSKNPDKNPPVELLDVVLLYGQTGVTGKGVTFNDILTKDVTIAIPNLGGSQHLIALELKAANPKIVIVPIAGAAAGLQLVVNKEVDVYITPAKTGKQMVQDFPNVSMVFEIPKNKRSIKIQNVTLSNYGMFALFVHSSATPLQKEAARDCVKKITASTALDEALAKVEAAPFRRPAAVKAEYVEKA